GPEIVAFRRSNDAPLPWLPELYGRDPHPRPLPTRERREGRRMLSLEHLSKTYAEGTRALANVTLTVHESEIVSVIGGSGCGKTTLLRLIAGLDRATAGVIELDGERLTEPHPAVGIVFQEPRLLPWLRVADN